MHTSSRLTVAAALALASCGPGRRPAAGAPPAASSPCLSNPSQAAQYALYVTRQLAWGDSASLAQQGLPAGPDVPVTLVDDPATCADAVRGMNAGLGVPPGGPQPIRRAYVFRLGRAAFAAVDEQTAERAGDVYMFLDARFRLIGTVAAIQ